MTKISGTREWAVAELNCSVGCPYQCRYCYARAKALTLQRIESVAEWAQVRTEQRAIQEDYPLFNGQVMFPASHDIVPENLDTCLSVIGRLLAKGNHVLIVSKPYPEMVQRLCDSFDACKEQLLFRFTITARNQKILSFWEPGAPGYRLRKESLAVALNRGYKTSVSIEPMLDKDDIHGLIDELSPLVTHSIWIGLMNKISERVIVDSHETRKGIARISAGQTDNHVRLLYESLKNNPLIRWKESIKNIVGLPNPSMPGMDI